MTKDDLRKRFPNASDDFIARNASNLAPLKRAVQIIEPAVKTRKDKGSQRPGHFQACLICGATFQAPKSAGRKYCSRKCAYSCKSRAAAIADPQRKDYGNAVCEQCGDTFHLTGHSGKARFCSHECARSAIGAVTISANRRIMPRTRVVTIECGACQKPFESWVSNHRVYCSEGCAAKIVPGKAWATNHARGNYAAAKSFTRGKAGWVELGDQRFFARSSWEANYARYLQFQKDNRLISRWEHEPETFWFKSIQRGVRSYLPDFRVTLNSGAIEYHEVKGWMDSKSQTKLKRMAKYYPAVKMVLIDAARYRAIARMGKMVVPGWITIRSEPNAN